MREQAQPQAPTTVTDVAGMLGNAPNAGDRLGGLPYMQMGLACIIVSIFMPGQWGLVLLASSFGCIFAAHVSGRRRVAADGRVQAGRLSAMLADPARLAIVAVRGDDTPPGAWAVLPENMADGDRVLLGVPVVPMRAAVRERGIILTARELRSIADAAASATAVERPDPLLVRLHALCSTGAA